jgi:hypothetical protein
MSVNNKKELAHLHFWSGLKARAARGEKISIETGVDIGGLGVGRSGIEPISSGWY